MAKNIQSLQLLRNTSMLYATRDAALAALTGGTIPGGNQDGTPVLARYKGTDGKIYTLVGYYADSSAISSVDSAASHMTVFDIEGSAADVNELKNMIGSGVTTTNTVTKQLQDLSGTTSDTSATTSVAGAKKYADEQVRAALDVLNTNSVANENKVVSDVTQANGKVTATVKNLTDVKLDGLSATADTKITSTDTLGGALAKLQGQINSMDKAAEAVAGKVVTTVTEEDGKVTETKASVKDLQLGGYSKEADATGDIESSDTINTALSKLENKVGANKVSNTDHSIVVTEPTGATTTDIKVNINSDEKVIKLGDNGIYTNLNLVKITDGLPATVKERYELRDSDNAKIGESIDIAKDSHIVSIKYITDGVHAQNLEYVYIDDSGNTQTTYIDMSALVLESEFASGVTVTNNIAHGVVDPSSETFLTVGAGGFKLAGVQNAINTAVNGLDSDVSGNSVHVTVGVKEVDGKVTAVTVNEANIADADDLEALSGKTITEVASSNDSITVTPSEAADRTKHLDIITDASKIKMAGFTKADALTGIKESSSVTEAFKEVDKVITDKAEVISTALNDLEATKAEKTALDAEIAARKAVDGQNGDKYAANANVNYIGNATSLNDADIKLDIALKAVDDAMLTRVAAGNGITVLDKASKSQTISAKVNGDGGIVNDGTGLHLGTIDCGTY